MTNEELLLLGRVAYELWDSMLVGNAPPKNQRRFERMEEPVPGDIVFERSTAPYWRRDDPRLAKPPMNASIDICIGRYQRSAREPIPTTEPIEPPTELVHYIESLDGTHVHRWTNADFITFMPVEGWPS